MRSGWWGPSVQAAKETLTNLKWRLHVLTRRTDPHDLAALPDDYYSISVTVAGALRESSIFNYGWPSSALEENGVSIPSYVSQEPRAVHDDFALPSEFDAAAVAAPIATVVDNIAVVELYSPTVIDEESCGAPVIAVIGGVLRHTAS